MRREKDTESRRRLRTGRHAEADDIGLRHLRKFLREREEHIPARHHHAPAFGAGLEHARVFARLQVEQGLVQPLPESPPHDGHRHEDLARGSIGRQTPALTARKERKTLGAAQPLVKIRTAIRLPGICQQLREAAAGPELHSGGVASAEPRAPGQGWLALEP